MVFRLFINCQYLSVIGGLVLIIFQVIIICHRSALISKTTRHETSVQFKDSKTVSVSGALIIDFSFIWNLVSGVIKIMC